MSNINTGKLKIAAYISRHEMGDMLWFDKAEAQTYCDDGAEPEPLVLESDIAQPVQPPLTAAQAVADELLEALQALLGADMEHVLMGDGKDDQIAAITKVHAAIAKATRGAAS